MSLEPTAYGEEYRCIMRDLMGLPDLGEENISAARGFSLASSLQRQFLFFTKEGKHFGESPGLDCSASAVPTGTVSQ
jgi:hypothetical protein